MDVTDRSFEPMDIDCSLNSIKNISNSDHDLLQDGIRDENFLHGKKLSSDIDNNQSTTDQKSKKVEKVNDQPIRWNVKRLHVNIHKKKDSTHQWKIMLLSFIILIGATLYCVTDNIKCVEVLNIDSIKEALTDKLHGQKNAIELIVHAFSRRDKILLLYGATGVGKSYAASIILKNYWNFTNVYHFTMPSFREEILVSPLLGLTMCNSVILVIDDLTVNNMDIIPEIENLISKSNRLGKKLTIILIFSCETVKSGFEKGCDKTFLKIVSAKFFEVKYDKDFVKFEPLTEKHLKMCIEDEIGENKISDERMLGIMKNFDVSVDGCKGVHNKVKYLNI